jgi:DtxR family Mn-dependent transcriptional regulator
MEENFTLSEENYLKAIYHLSTEEEEAVSTNALAERLQTTAASVSDMLKKLAKKELIEYKKYQGVNISEKGKRVALQIIRKHRLWEVFLVEKLSFNWDEVHEIAEQLEHIDSPILVKRLDEFLGYPKFDPHGDPIPDERGEFQSMPQITLSEMEPNQSGLLVGVKDTNSLFLRHLDKIGAYIGAKIKVLEKVEFDGSIEILLEDKKTLFISKEVASNLLITKR